MITSLDTVPALAELQSIDQWVCYTYPEKVPFSPTTGKAAKANDPSTWGTHSQAIQALSKNKRYHGAGIEITKENNITGLDCDDCITDSGKFTSDVSAAVKQLNSFSYITPSKKGVRVLAHGSIPRAITAEPFVDHFEMYCDGRYFTITDQRVKGTPEEIKDRQDVLTALFNEIVASRKAKSGACSEIRKKIKELAEWTTSGRNNQLAAVVYRCGVLIGQKGLIREAIEQELLKACQKNGLLDEEEYKTRSTIERQIKAGIDQAHENPSPSLNGDYVPPTDAAPVIAQGHEPFHLTDLGNAERFAAQHEHHARWCKDWNSWMVFNGRAWEQDKTDLVDRWAKQTVRSIYGEAAREEDKDQRARIAKHAALSESSRAVRAMLDRAKSELPVTPNEFNKRLHLFNFKNGTMDLRTGKLRPHEASDMLTRCVMLNHNPQPTPVFDKFFDTIFAGDQELKKYVLMALGMSLSGDIREQCWFLCHGDGSNGKSTLFELVRTLLEDYAIGANIESFLARKDDHSYDKAEFYGARMITASEIPPKSRLNEAFLKKITGGEDLRAARKYEREFQFTPECTIWLSVNHLPTVKDTSKGMWRRVRYIPFTVTIPESQIDTNLPKKLLQEAEGILALLVEGCKAWYSQGRLITPQAVVAATQKYQEDQDTIARFLSEECIRKPGSKTLTRELNARYEWWCEQKQEKPDAAALREALNRLGLIGKRSTGGKYAYDGIALKPMDVPPDPRDSEPDFTSLSSKSEPSEVSEPKRGKVSLSVSREENFTQISSPGSLGSLPAQKLLAEMDSQGCTLRIRDDGAWGIGVPDEWTDEQFSALKARIDALDAELRLAIQNGGDHAQ